ncbi:hypothetical protein FACS1894130_10360 [Spirochaetia bacterium]|nr:hypothetical protein FACS1894130_10360 [Spirochaetia bacterium]
MSMQNEERGYKITQEFINDTNVVTITIPSDILIDAKWLDNSGNEINAGIPRYPIETFLSVKCGGNIHDNDKIIFRVFYKNPPISENTCRDEASSLVSSAIAKSLWKYKYTDDDYGKPSELFFLAYSPQGKTIQSGLFDTGWKTLYDVNIQGGENYFKQVLNHRILFKDLINGKTRKLARIVYKHRNELDKDSIAYLKSFKTRFGRIKAMKDIFDSIIVYKDINLVSQKKGFDHLGLPNLFEGSTNFDGMTLGTMMYFKVGIIPSIMNDDTANLLGHEAIHALQAHAFGMGEGKNINKDERRAHFITFCLNNAYTEEANPYELTAYKFGGHPLGHINNFKTIQDRFGTVILARYPLWWKR